MLTENEVKLINAEYSMKVAEAYEEAFLKGTDKAWNTYRRKLRKLKTRWEELRGVEISLDGFEDWALSY